MKTKSNENCRVQKPLKNKLVIIINIIFAILFTIMATLTISMIWVKDSRHTPSYCLSCHNDPYSSNWKSTMDTNLVVQHKDLGISCQTCHARSLDNTFNEIKTYLLEPEKLSLKEKRLPKEDCLICHGSYSDIIPFTDPSLTDLGRNPHDSHLGQIDCGICHNMHRPSVYACSECHDSQVISPGWENID